MVEKSKKPPKTDKKIIGERIRAVRAYTGLNRIQFCRKHDLRESTVKDWELGKGVLREGGLRTLLAALKTENILCSREWILQGVGSPPYKTGEVDASENPSGDVSFEIDSFLNNHASAMVFQVENEDMLPFYEPGDYVGGIKVHRENLREPKLHAIILGHGDKRYIRSFKVTPSTQDYVLSASNPLLDKPPQFLSEIKHKAIYKIIWHRKMDVEV